MPRLDEVYDWMPFVRNEPLDLAIFTQRAQTALIRHNIRTWGDLGALNDEELAKLWHVGELTVARIHSALEDHGPNAVRRITAMENWHLDYGSPAEPEPRDSDLATVTAWAVACGDDLTLSGLISAITDGVDMPDEVRQAARGLRLRSLSQMVGSPVPNLSEQLDNLVAAVDTPELAAREFGTKRPTWQSLGDKSGVSREAVRKRVAKAALHLRGLLAADRYRSVRLAAHLMVDDFGAFMPANSPIVEKWSARLKEGSLGALLWIAGYEREDSWLVRGGSLADVRATLEVALRDRWLVDPRTIGADISITAHPEALRRLLVDSGAWRGIAGGYVIRWDGTLQAKAERILRLKGTPMTPAELIEAIGRGSERSLKNTRGSMVRIDKQFRLALPEWGYQEYESVTKEIEKRVRRGGGAASVSAILVELSSEFGIKEASVRAYLHSDAYAISGDEVRIRPHISYTPAAVEGRSGVIRVGDRWGQRLNVTEHNLKGYSFQIDRDVAAHNGLEPKDSLIVPALHAGRDVGEASLIWRMSNLNNTVDVGRLSTALHALGVCAGDEITVVATPTECIVLLVEDALEQRRAHP